MNVIHFIPSPDLPLVNGWVWGPHTPRTHLRMVLDTGSGMTIVATHILERIGYSEQDRVAKSVIRSAVGDEHGFVLRVKQFRCLGHDFPNQHIHAQPLLGHYDIDGLLGWDILRRFNFDVRPREGHLVVSPIDGP